MTTIFRVQYECDVMYDILCTWLHLISTTSFKTDVIMFTLQSRKLNLIEIKLLHYIYPLRVMLGCELIQGQYHVFAGSTVPQSCFPFYLNSAHLLYLRNQTPCENMSTSSYMLLFVYFSAILQKVGIYKYIFYHSLGMAQTIKHTDKIYSMSNTSMVFENYSYANIAALGNLEISTKVKLF